MRRIGPIFWPLLLIAAGVVFLLSNLGLLSFDLGQIWRLWPVILVVIGLDILLEVAVRRGRPAETISIDQGALTEARVSVEFGAGELRMGPGAPAGKLLEGEFSDGAEYQVRTSEVRLYGSRDWSWWGWRGRTWDVRLTREIPLGLRLSLGACQARLDLSDLRVTDVTLETGAADTSIRFPRAAGMTRARVKAGAAQVTLSVPEGVAARIAATMAIGSLNVDTQRFPPSGGGYASADYDTAANKLDLSIEGGVGSVSVS
jgi:LiaI-LiaF-like transmembrane region